MPQIETGLLVPAPRAAIWAVLTDFAAYPLWNPLVLEAEGGGAAGARIDILVARPDGSGKRDRFRARVEEWREGEALAWRGRVPLLFDGRHWFRLEDRAGGTLLRHGEIMRGLVPWLGGARMAAAYRPGYLRFNEALAARVAALG